MRWRVCIAAVLLALPAGAGAQRAAAASFGQLALPGGCIAEPTDSPSDNETTGCGTGHALTGASGLAVSADGKDVYVTGNYRSGFGWGAIATFSRDASTGVLTETGCISSDGSESTTGTTGTCTVAPGVRGADALAISPDGTRIYVGTSVAGGIATFARDPQTGAIGSELGCVVFSVPVGSPCLVARVFQNEVALAFSPPWLLAGSTRGAVSALTPAMFGFAPASSNITNPCIAIAGPDDSCANGTAMPSIDSLAVSSDGRTVYAASTGGGAVDTFSVDPATGTLTQTGCLLAKAPAGPCDHATLLSTPTSIALAGDGRNLYVADEGSDNGPQIVVLNRDPASGKLTERTCYDELSLPDNGSSSSSSSSVHKAQSDPCTSVPGLDSVSTLAISPDGGTVYGVGNDSLAVFTRDPATGALTESLCAVPMDSRCSTPTGLEDASATAVSPDGRNLYIVAGTSAAITTFGPAPAVNSASVHAARNGIVRIALTCPRRAAAGCAGTVVLGRIQPRRAHTAALSTRAKFRLSAGRSAVVAVRLPKRLQQRLRTRHKLVVAAVVLPAAGGGGTGRRTITIT